ncbi:MAG: OmpH family outer membrane protein [Bacteroidota bacterium]
MKLERIGLALLTVALVSLYALYFTSKTELVYVDTNKLLNNYQGMLDARKEYQQKASSWKANVDTLMNEVQLQIMDYERESASLTKKEKELSKELIRTKQQQLQDYQKAIQSQAQNEDFQMTQSVIEQVNKYLKTYGESRSYKIILAATDAGNIVYAQDGLDITDEVLEGLNKEYRGE